MSDWRRIPLAAVLCSLVAMLGWAPHNARAADLETVSKAVVKLFVTMQGWDMKQPWRKGRIQNPTCSAFFIKQGILTNAHCVTDATYILMEMRGIAEKKEVRVVAVNHQVDLALLEPVDPSFDPHIKPVTFGDLPNVREKVVTVGYPLGGLQVSYTEGVVSRIDVMSYVHSNIGSVLVQTDAAINPGNSGGPVFSDAHGSCLGVATQKSLGGEAMGYFIPTPVIRQFLEDIQDGNIKGIPTLGSAIQQLENEAFREALGMKDGETGVRVVKIARGSSADGKLEPDDVLLDIEGHQIFNDGRVPFRHGGKISFGYYYVTRQVGESVRFHILRAGKERDIKIQLHSYPVTVIPRLPKYDQPPRYFEIAGLVFQAVEPRYLHSWGRSWFKNIPIGIKSYFSSLIGDMDLDELVIISGVFNSTVNKGYDGIVENTRVKEINGMQIHRLSDVKKAFAITDGPYHTVELDSDIRIVLDRKLVAEQEDALRQRYNIQ